jgi:hypothetical protein
LSQTPKLKITALGQKVKNLPIAELPTTDQLVISTDPSFEDSGSFQSGLFSGDWEQKKTRIKSTAASFVFTQMAEELLSQGAFGDYTITDHKMKREKAVWKATEEGNTLRGKFTYRSTWKVKVMFSGQKLTVPFNINLTMPFTATRMPAQ